MLAIDRTLRAAYDLSIAADFPSLPAPTYPAGDQASELMKAARNYDPAEQQRFLDTNLAKLNADQQQAFEQVIAAVHAPAGQVSLGAAQLCMLQPNFLHLPPADQHVCG